MADSLRLSGLATGLDTSTLISQLMSFERRPIGLMQKTQTLAQSRIDIYRAINTKLSALQRAADKVKGLSFSTTVAPTSAGATVANPALLSANVTGSPTAGTYNVTVNSLAKAQITGGGTFNTPPLGGTTTATSGNTSFFTATAAPGTAAGSYNVTVNSVAQTQQISGGTFTQPNKTATSSNPAIMTGTVTNAATVGNPSVQVLTLASAQTNTGGIFRAPNGAGTLIIDGGTTAAVTVNVANGDSIDTVISKINATAGVGMTASKNVVGGNSYLVLTGKDADTYTITGTMAARMRIDAANDTQVNRVQGSIKYNGGATITTNNLTNTYTGVATGVDITASAVGTANLNIASQAGMLTFTGSTSGTKNVAIADGDDINTVMNKINAAATGMTASISGGNLVLTGNTNGETFTVTGTNGIDTRLGIDSATKTTRTASLASISIDGGAAITGTSNTFTNPIPGVTINAVAPGSSTLTLSSQAGSLRITNQSTNASTDVAIASGATITQVRDAINAANTGMIASISSGALVLTGASSGVSFTVADTGGGNGFAASLGIDSASKTTQIAAQASVTVNGTTSTGTSNVFSTAINGLDLNLAATGSTTVTVTAANAGSTASDDPVAAVRDMVDKFNDVVNYIKENSSYNTTTKKSGALTGDYTVNALRTNLTKMMTGLVDDTSATANGYSAGLMLQRDGTINFDSAKFQAALTADQAGVKALFATEDNLFTPDNMSKLNSIGTTGVKGDGIANRISAFVDSMVSTSSMYNTIDPITGLRSKGALLGAIQNNELTISTLNKRIEEYEVRLKEKERALLSKFSAMEKSVALLRNQGNYLSGQFFAMSQSGQ